MVVCCGCVLFCFSELRFGVRRLFAKRFVFWLFVQLGVKLRQLVYWCYGSLETSPMNIRLHFGNPPSSEAFPFAASHWLFSSGDFFREFLLKAGWPNLAAVKSTNPTFLP